MGVGSMLLLFRRICTGGDMHVLKSCYKYALL